MATNYDEHLLYDYHILYDWAAIIALTLTETLSLVDNLTIAGGFHITVSDAVTLTDTLAYAQSLVVKINETLSLADSLSINKKIGVLMTEGITLLEKIYGGLSINMSETITTTDTFLQSIGININEIMNLVDQFSTISSMNILSQENINLLDMMKLCFNGVTDIWQQRVDPSTNWASRATPDTLWTSRVIPTISWENRQIPWMCTQNMSVFDYMSDWISLSELLGTTVNGRQESLWLTELMDEQCDLVETFTEALSLSDLHDISPTAWVIDLPWTTYDSKYYHQNNGLIGIFMDPTGTYMYLWADGYGSPYIKQYTLGTPFDVTTAIYTNQMTTFYAPHPFGFYIRPNWDNIYVTSRQWAYITQFGMASSWVLPNGLVYTRLLDVSSQDSNPLWVFFKYDGSELYMVGWSSSKIWQYHLTTPWNISTVTTISSYYLPYITHITFNDIGTKFFVWDSSNLKIKQYSCWVAWDITTASDDWVSYTAPHWTADIYMSVKNATKLYITDDSSWNVYEYTVPQI